MQDDGHRLGMDRAHDMMGGIAIIAAGEEGERRPRLGRPPDTGEREDGPGRKAEPMRALLAGDRVRRDAPFLKRRDRHEAASLRVRERRSPEWAAIVTNIDDGRPHALGRREAPAHDGQIEAAGAADGNEAGPARCDIILLQLCVPGVVRSVVVEDFPPFDLQIVEVAHRAMMTWQCFSAKAWQKLNRPCLRGQASTRIPLQRPASHLHRGISRDRKIRGGIR